MAYTNYYKKRRYPREPRYTQAQWQMMQQQQQMSPELQQQLQQQGVVVNPQEATTMGTPTRVVNDSPLGVSGALLSDRRNLNRMFGKDIGQTIGIDL